MGILTSRLRARINTGIALLMLPLLALMPLLHGHPLGATGSQHPVGVHVPSATGPAGPATAAGGASGAPAAAAGQGPAAEGGAPATIVVQEARLRAGERSRSPQRVAFIAVSRASVAVASASPGVRRYRHDERPQPWPLEPRPQAPPSGATTAA